LLEVFRKRLYEDALVSFRGHRQKPPVRRVLLEPRAAAVPSSFRTEPALDSRCVVTIRFPLLGPAGASFLFAGTSQRGLSSSMSSFHAAMGVF
jgi:hypothetical protein